MTRKATVLLLALLLVAVFLPAQAAMLRAMSADFIRLSATTVATGDEITISFTQPSWAVKDYQLDFIGREPQGGTYQLHVGGRMRDEGRWGSVRPDIYSDSPGIERTHSFSPKYEGTGYFRLSLKDAYDRVIYVNSATVTVEALPPVEELTCVVTPIKRSFTVGERLVADVKISGGRAPYKVEVVTDAAEGAVYTQGQVLLALEKAGDFDLSVYVTDADERSADAWSYFSVKDIIVSLNKSSYALGEAVIGTLVLGDQVPKSVRVKLGGDDNLMNRELDYKEGRVSVVPPKSGSYYLLADVFADDSSFRRYRSPWFTVVGEAPKCHVTIDNPTPVLGDTVTASWTITGGVPPYTVKGGFLPWWERGNFTISSVRDQSGASGSHSWEIHSVDTAGQFIIEVTDSRGIIVSVEGDRYILRKAEALSVRLMLDKQGDYNGAYVNPGEKVTATWRIRGGMPPYALQVGTTPFMMTAEWLPDLPSHSGDSFTWTPKESESIRVQIQVRDANGTEAMTYAYVQILEPVQHLYLSNPSPKVGDTVTALWKTAPGETAPVNFDYKWMPPFAESNYQTYIYQTFTIPYAGTYSLYVSASGEGVGGVEYLTFTVAASPGVPTASVRLNGSTFKAGDPIVASWEMVGDMSDYHLSGRWFIDDRAFMQLPELTGSSATLNALGDTGRFALYVYDEDGIQGVYYSDTFIVEDSFASDVPKVILNVDKAEVMLGGTVTATWQIAGGAAPYTITDISWKLYNADDHLFAGDKSEVFPEDEKDGKASLTVPTSTDQTHGALQVSIADALGNTSEAVSSVFRIVAPDIPAQPLKPGDANADTHVDIKDLTSLIDHLVGGAALNSQANADANNSGQVDLDDALWLISVLIN